MMAWEDPTPEHVAWMKESGELQGKIRQNQDVEASAKRMAAIYKEVEGFWAKRSEIGAKSSKDAQEAANALASAAASGADAQALRAAAKQLGASCMSCHQAHREKVSEGVYKIK